jgi:hypothetical protein
MMRLVGEAKQMNGTNRRMHRELITWHQSILQLVSIWGSPRRRNGSSSEMKIVSQRICLRVMAGLVWLGLASLGGAQENPAIIFNKNFEGGALGKIEKLGDAQFRCYVEGQCDEHGRNRQANWYYFRMDGVEDREVTVTLADFVGEYNDKPGACAMNADTIPVFSYDDEHWQHFPAMDWDDQKKEATLKFRPEHERIWIAHIPPYTHSRLLRLLEQLDRAACVRIEVIGKTVQGRDLHLVTMTNFEKPDDGKKTVWLQARQHAWEAGTSQVMEGALLQYQKVAPGTGASDAPLECYIFKYAPAEVQSARRLASAPSRARIRASTARHVEREAGLAVPARAATLRAAVPSGKKVRSVDRDLAALVAAPPDPLGEADVARFFGEFSAAARVDASESTRRANTHIGDQLEGCSPQLCRTGRPGQLEDK